MTWEELVADATARHPIRESKMFGMPRLKREHGKVVAGYAEYRLELEALRAQGIEPTDAFFERHDIFDV